MLFRWFDDRLISTLQKIQTYFDERFQQIMSQLDRLTEQVNSLIESEQRLRQTVVEEHQQLVGLLEANATTQTELKAQNAALAAQVEDLKQMLENDEDLEPAIAAIEETIASLNSTTDTIKTFVADEPPVEEPIEVPA